MIRKFLLPALAIAGALFAAWSAANASRKTEPTPPVVPPARSLFASAISGAGIVEASSENIAIGSPVSRIVTDVFVRIGQEVKKGEPLFRLDDRDWKAQLGIRRTALELAEAKLNRLRAAPRIEDVPPAEARVAAEEAVLADLRWQLQKLENLSADIVAPEEMARARYAVDAGAARLLEARARLELLKAGAWQADLDVAKAEVDAARAEHGLVETEMERLTVRAPVDGTVLQANVRVGEFAAGGVMATPLIVFGATHPLHVRVDVDENDAWRFRSNAPAVAFVRGNRDLETKLTFVRTEPFVIPKRSLTGQSTERVDTRVLQVIYSFDPKSIPVYVGQQMDVYIEAGNAAGASGTPTSQDVEQKLKESRS